MEPETARKVTDTVLASAAIAAAIVVVTTPPLRRIARQALRIWLGTSVPLFLLRQAQRAWVDSGHGPRMRAGRAA